MPKLLASPYLPEPADADMFNADAPVRGAGPIGILMINLGTPDQPEAKAIRRYLGEFLSDPRVIEIPQALWQIILRLFILPRRPAKLAPRYRDIWLAEGAPLLVWSQAQAEGLQELLSAQGHDVRVELGMRYGNPSIASGLDKLKAAGCERILGLPLYPQYAASTTATAFDCVAAHLGRQRNQPELRFIKRYHTHPDYIRALASQVRSHWDAHGKPDRLLLSFHGLPRRCVELGDPYLRDCRETAAALRAELDEPSVPVQMSFQSRFGAQRWLEPYTEPLLRQWGKEGVGRVDAMCPGFLADCLETLEEIQVECREAFLEEGGREFHYIPCLNADPEWIDGLGRLAVQHLGGWLPCRVVPA